MINIDAIDFTKSEGLVPVIIQDSSTLKVLMLGYMNQEALETTLAGDKVCFFSRSKNRLWTKGEESGHFLFWDSIKMDCDADTLLVKVRPQGPVCHTGTDTCWKEENTSSHFLSHLQSIIEQRKEEDSDESYTASLFRKGINKIAQKVGEEAVELVIEAKDDNEELFLGEAADLIYHYLILLVEKGYGLDDISTVLRKRHN